jgi:hypothetical protein
MQAFVDWDEDEAFTENVNVLSSRPGFNSIRSIVPQCRIKMR